MRFVIKRIKRQLAVSLISELCEFLINNLFKSRSLTYFFFHSLAEHVLDALNKLGFSDFTRDALNVLNDCKLAAAKRRRQSTRLENLGISEEELYKQQQELIRQAREQMNEEFQLQTSALNNHLQTQTIDNKENCDDDDDDDY